MRKKEKEGDSLPFDYTNYPHLHTEDSVRKITEITSVIPAYFRARSVLDVGSDAGLITRAIGEKYKSKRVDALDLSTEGIRLTQNQLQGFTESRVEQRTIEQYEADCLYDLIMFIDVVEHLENPEATLQKASTMGDYTVIRSPLEDTVMNKVNKSFYGKDYQKVMEERYGHIQHFSVDSLSSLIQQSGFDVVNSKSFRVPTQADILKKPSQKRLEQLSWMLSKKEVYPHLWGGFYVAFCKSRQTRVMDAQSEKELLDLLEEEFGADNVVSLALFGSLASRNHNKYSDYDFTIILKTASQDVAEREAASPRLKNRLREKGLGELCAFNIYTQAEFEEADKSNSWLIETMKNGNRIIRDSDEYLTDKMSTKKPTVEQIGTFAWKGIETETPDQFIEVAQRHAVAAKALEADLPNFSLYHKAEGYRGELMASQLSHGVYNSRDSLLTIAKRLKYKFNEQIDLETVQQLNFEQEMVGKPSLYQYDNVDQHLTAANILLEKELSFDALFHTYSALKCVYIKKLHEQGIFALDGEITQLFLREQSQNLSSNLVSRIHQFSFKAEQFLGRTGYISFDLGSNGKSIFATEGKEDVSGLIEQLRLLISDLKTSESDSLGIRNTQPKISLAIATYNRPQYLEKCMDSVAKLLIPADALEVVIVDDGSDQEYDIEALQAKSPFAIKYVRKEHSGICATKNRAIEESTGEFIAFLDDDMVVSPLWLSRLMSGFINERIAGVGSTNLTYPDNNSLTQYSDYRELARRPFRDQTGEVLNVLTGSACLRKKVLLEVGGFNQRQSAEGVPFGGDDVDITWKIRDAGYKFSHADDSAIAFHNHRSTMKSFIKQHIGYGEGTMFHCIDKNRDPSELGIPEPTIRAVTTDLAHYLLNEVPQRVVKCHKDNLGIQKSLTYPALDFTRRFFYDLGILKARKHIKKYEK